MNAAINMLTLLVEGQRRGGQRVLAFQREPKTAAGGAIATPQTSPTGDKRIRETGVVDATTTKEPRRCGGAKSRDCREKYYDIAVDDGSIVSIVSENGVRLCHTNDTMEPETVIKTAQMCRQKYLLVASW